ncbi:MAG TPA: hypothetical protein VK645_10350 [Chitinophagaceae bacterium]|nr:hypothetical protein [Chitinophagaceae bacterium]
MKKTCAIVCFIAGFLLTGVCVTAQDSTKHGVVKQINSSSEKSDNLHGNKIRQQSLSKDRFEKLAAIAANPVKKKQSKRPRKHQ